MDEHDLTDDQERDLIVAAAAEATSAAFLVAEASEHGACIARHGWVVRVRHGVIMEWVKPLPFPVHITACSFYLCTEVNPVSQANRSNT
jgi:hypothetical protein